MSSPEVYRPSPASEASRRQPEILARLEQAVGAIQDSETFRAYLDVQARFHHYSPGNVALILAQRPESTRVAGYNAWLRMHRYVKRGERAIKIIVPMTKKIETEDGEEERKLIFGTGNVFDISQTDGEPLPEVAVPTLEGDEGAPLFTRLSELAQAEQLTVRTVTPDAMPTDTMMGYYEKDQRAIFIREAAPLQMVKTLAHELGHHFAGHARSDPESETAAEAIAYVVCAHFGLDTGERSFPYIATWAQDKKVLQQALTTIQKVSATMIDRIEQRATGPKSLPPMAGGAPLPWEPQEPAHSRFFGGRTPFELLAEAQAGLERLGYYFTPVEKEHTEGLITEPLVHRLRTHIKKRGFAKVAGHTIITFTGYEPDPREVFEIPEARAYYKKLDSELPELPALVAYLPELGFNGPGLYLLLMGEVDAMIHRPERAGYDVHVAYGDELVQQAVRRITEAGAKYHLPAQTTQRLIADFLAGATHRFS
jgi:hypothetical protein